MIVFKKQGKHRKQIKNGNGLFNAILNKLPLPEMHLPHVTGEKVLNGSFNNKKRYSYCGPFTKFDQRNKEGYVRVNDLDKACKIHDKTYGYYTDIQSRNKADDVLANTANIIANTTNDSQESKDARLVESIMSAKSRFGFGLKK